MRTFIFLLMGMLSSGCALAQPAASKFTVRVLDAETGLPVTNAVVESTFELDYDPWGNRPDKVDERKETVDKNGEVTLVGNTIQRGGGGRVFADGYYWGGGGVEYTGKSIALNRWEPWNPTIEVKLRPKKNPVPMVSKQIELDPIPVFEKPVGFDLEKADWVAPYGKGCISDFIFSVSTNVTPKKGVHYAVGFSNQKDGIQIYLPPNELHSSYVWPYEAPLTQYETGLDKYFIFHFPKVEGPPFHNVKDNKDVNYIFRTRAQADKNGNIVAACYGRIQGEIRVSSKGMVSFAYVFNPNPHSRSLECDERPY
jgi:hypothetical protein